MTKFQDLDGVTLLEDLPEHGLTHGEFGTIVHVFSRPHETYEVEFTAADGSTRAMLPLLPHQIALRLPEAEPGGTAAVP